MMMWFRLDNHNLQVMITILFLLLGISAGRRYPGSSSRLSWHIGCKKHAAVGTTSAFSPHESTSMETDKNNARIGTNDKLVASVKDHARGGATVVAKTMTARQFEMFNLFSGGVAGTVAACITNPLEVLKAQLQSSNAASGELISTRGHPGLLAKKIMEQDGVAGFFRGLPPTLIGIIPARSAYFYAYQRSKKALGPYLPEGSPGNALLAGMVAGISGNTITNPIFMVRTRMQLLADHTVGQRAYNGYGDAIRTIFQEEGMAGFYKGITASYWGCTEGALQFIVYEQFKSRLVKKQNLKRAERGLPPTEQLPKLTYFCSAAAAKMVAAIATYPHEVARTRLREQARAGVFKYKGMWQTIRLVAREEGTKSLYSGMGVHLMKVVPNSALMFLTYEVVRHWLGEFTIIDNNNSNFSSNNNRKNDKIPGVALAKKK